jgi:hypothetical protein
MVYLLFDAERDRPASPWAFWRYDYASVYAWLDAPDVAVGKSRAEQTMKRKGWRIVSYEHAKFMTDDQLPNDIYAKACIKMARATGSSYTFDRMARPGARNAAADADLAKMADFDGLDVDPARVPPALRPALELGRRWAIGDDVQRSRATRRSSEDERRAILERLAPVWDEIERWCETRREQTPVPDEVVVFDLLLEAATEMQAGLETDPANRS